MEKSVDQVIFILICLDSSMVEHAAVNRGVAGSSPARGAEKTVFTDFS